MNRTSSPTTPPATDSTTGSAPERGVLMDLLAVTPSATLGRELFALVANLALVVLIVLVLRPETIVVAVMLSVLGLFVLGRLAVGFRTRGYAASLRGEC